MIRLATVFSGIGSVEHVFKHLCFEHEIVFACDNGERKLGIDYDSFKLQTQGLGNAAVNKVLEKLYCEQAGENYVQTSYMANYPLPVDRFFQDVKMLDGREFAGQVDLFVGGSPCQSFSIMGKRKGLEEARGTLFYEYARLVGEIKPKVFIYENVTGMLNHDGGRTWEVISRIFDSLGYLWTYWVLNAKKYGLAQNRARIFVVGFRKDLFCFFNKLKKPVEVLLDKTVEDYLEPFVPNKYYLPEKGFKRVTDPKQAKHVALNGRIARCQVACQQFNWFGDMRFETFVPPRLEDDPRVYKGYYCGERGVARCLTPRECLRLMGYEDDFVIAVSDAHMYRQSGNSIAVNVMRKVVESIFETGVFDDEVYE